jgi:hypothetical protein
MEEAANAASSAQPSLLNSILKPPGSLGFSPSDGLLQIRNGRESSTLFQWRVCASHTSITIR